METKRIDSLKKDLVYLLKKHRRGLNSETTEDLLADVMWRALVCFEVNTRRRDAYLNHINPCPTWDVEPKKKAPKITIKKSKLNRGNNNEAITQP